MRNFFSLYDKLIDGMGEDAAEITVSKAFSGECWAMIEAGGRMGIAMEGTMDTAPLMYENRLTGLTLAEAAKAVKSWNLVEAAMGLAAINAYYNTKERMDALHCAEPYENYCTAGINFRGKRLGVIGHLRLRPEIRANAAEIFTLERSPKPGDYPDSACDVILPRCDIVFITGSSITNKTLPHLLELCRDSLTIMVGPSVPMCPALLDYGIDRLSGLALTDNIGMRARALSGEHGNPYTHGQSFLLKK